MMRSARSVRTMLGESAATKYARVMPLIKHRKLTNLHMGVKVDKYALK